MNKVIELSKEKDNSKRWKSSDGTTEHHQREFWQFTMCESLLLVQLAVNLFCSNSSNC